MKEEAVSLGLCKQWTSEWSDGSSRDELVDKFVRGLDFCIEHDWPSVDVMKRDFGDVIHRHGVYADERVDLDEASTVVLNGCCVADLRYSGNSVGDVYVRHDSRACVVAHGLARVHVTVYDRGVVSVCCDEDAQCFIYLHGGEVLSLEGNGKIVVRDKRNEEGGER